MTTTLSTPSDSPLAPWLTGSVVRPRRRGAGTPVVPNACLRLTFYGRISTSRQQDPETSRQWQRDDAARVIAGYGRIVMAFFDVGYSRSLPWHPRPHAAALLRAGRYRCRHGRTSASDVQLEHPKTLFVIVCIPVAVTLHTGAAEPESEATPTELPGGRFLLPIPQPRRPTKNPTKTIPPT